LQDMRPSAAGSGLTKMTGCSSLDAARVASTPAWPPPTTTMGKLTKHLRLDIFGKFAGLSNHVGSGDYGAGFGGKRTV